MKTTTTGKMKRLALVAVPALAAWLAARPALAVVIEPNGLMVPQPQTATEIMTAAMTNPLYPVVSLDALFQARGEAIAWQTDANKKPDTFSPVCGFTAELVLHGGGCQIDFGWYNVTDTMPTDAQIYPLITAAQIAALPLPAFDPGAGQAGPMFNAQTILSNPNYKGGLIGFATKAGKTGNCTQTHFSQQQWNVLCTAPDCNAADGDNHWIAAINYKSTVDPQGYYIAFEDLPMGPMSFAGYPGQMYMNDGDLNDFVFFVSGVTCPGGGKACSTGKQGVCSDGINECEPGGALTCKQLVQPSPERCDGLDNDCNGVVDDGDNLCQNGFVCSQGQCIGPCGDIEFPCGLGLVCVDGYCLEPGCVNVTCPPGQVCEGGTCHGPCDGVTCPLGQVCRVGRCIDPCAGVTCDSDRVCRGGICVQSCSCLACDDGFTCEMSSGRCVSSGCENMTCSGAGQVCDKGSCMDACANAVCPAGQKCESGNCVDTTGGSGAGGGVVVGGMGGSGVGAGGATGARDAGIDMGAQGVDSGGPPPPRSTPPSCRCEVDPGPPGPAVLLAALGLVVLLKRSSGARRSRPGSRGRYCSRSRPPSR
jgi:hypothetical protein